ncbi:sulfite oxidase heme-binding subunit YedZ [Candidatus Leptofilum sp.]|uniref:sulfite oxidase heme-binding subunit YedZ n=1 Tax=Candidatus Leptofilum sp. TaxID=3241576 RepID=UPI003B5AEC28
MSVISGRDAPTVAGSTQLSSSVQAVSAQPKSRNRKKTVRRLTWVTHLGAWVPLVVLVAEYFTNNLGVDPVREILFHTGTTALVLLVLSLAVTPVNIVFGWKQVISLRRPLGLYAFFYVCLHLLTFIWLDYALNLAFIIDGIVEQPFVLVGTVAFLLLIPLAITSTKGWQRRLGKRWKRLHKLSYLIIILVLVHFIWLVKNVYIEPGIYAGIVALLFLARWQPIKTKLLRWQRRSRNRVR